MKRAERRRVLVCTTDALLMVIDTARGCRLEEHCGSTHRRKTLAAAQCHRQLRTPARRWAEKRGFQWADVAAAREWFGR